jgi:hypothetical protein
LQVEHEENALPVQEAQLELQEEHTVLAVGVQVAD